MNLLKKHLEEFLLLHLLNDNYFSAVFSAVQIIPSLPRLTWKLNVLTKRAGTLLHLLKIDSASS